MTSWKTVEDVHKDFFEYSDFLDDDDEEILENFAPAPPKSIAEYKARTAFSNSIFDKEERPDGFSFGGRGRGMPLWRSRPGKQSENSNSDIQLQKQIRQIVGLGYSNELIEQSLTKSSPEAPEGITVPDLRLKSLSLDSSKLKDGTPKVSISTITKKIPKRVSFAELPSNESSEDDEHPQRPMQHDF